MVEIAGEYHLHGKPVPEMRALFNLAQERMVKRAQEEAQGFAEHMYNKINKQ
jgi:hypothetical protein